MLPLTAVVVQSDPESASALVASLLRHFHTVRVAGSLEEARAAIPRHRAEFAIVDLELVGIADVQHNLARTDEHGHPVHIMLSRKG